MGKFRTPKKSTAVSKETWTIEYSKALELVQNSKLIVNIHINTPFVFRKDTGTFFEEEDGNVGYYSNAGRITAFVRKTKQKKISAGLQFRLKGVIEYDQFIKTDNFQYRILNRSNARSKETEDEIIITIYLNTTQQKHLLRFVDDLQRESKRFYLLYMKNNVLPATVIPVDEEETVDDLPF